MSAGEGDPPPPSIVAAWLASSRIWTCLQCLSNCHCRVFIAAAGFLRNRQAFSPGTEVAIHLLSLTGGLFKKANKWLRSPSFKVGQPRPSASAFVYMLGP